MSKDINEINSNSKKVYPQTHEETVSKDGIKIDNESLKNISDGKNIIASAKKIVDDIDTLSITSIQGGTFSTSDIATITYTTNKPVINHEFSSNAYNGVYYYTEPKLANKRVKKVGTNSYVMSFQPSELSVGTKKGSLRVTDADGNKAVASYKLIINNISQSIQITSIQGGTFSTSQSATIKYTTNRAVIKHEFNLHYDTSPSSFTVGTTRVTSNGTTYTMSFPSGDLSAGTKNGAIRVTDASGNTAIKTFTFIINTDSSSTPSEPETLKEPENGVQKIKIDGTVGQVPMWGAWANWKGSGYTPLLYNVKVDTKPNTMDVSAENNVLSKIAIGTLMNKPQEGVSVSYYNGNIQIFLGVKGSDAKAYLKSNPITVLLKTDKKTETPTNPAPEEPKDPTSQPPTDDNQAIKDWDAFNNTHGNYVAYSPSQVEVNGKKIKMTAIKKTTTVTPKGGTGQVATKNYISGAMVTKKAFKYGTFTFKFKLSANNTYLWPMIWTLPDNVNMARPELDLLESWGSYTNNSVVQTLHVYTPSGQSLTNVVQKQTQVDLTKEHTLKIVWSTNNTITMYCDGKQTLTYNVPANMKNYKTGEYEYQVWFLNLGLGTYDGKAPNGAGWFEITDYSFEPVYTRTRQRQHYWNGNFTDGTLPSGSF